MIESGINSALDISIEETNLLNLTDSALINFPIEQYGLATKSVLDSIAHLAGVQKKSPIRAYHASAEVVPELIRVNNISELFEKSRETNSTFNIEHLEKFVPEISAFAVDLTAAFGGTVAIHAFISAGGTPATRIHYDYSDAFTFQLLGTKWWRCYDYLESPTYGPEGSVVKTESVGPLRLDHLLSENECLFIPQGGLHLVESLPNVDSVHLAVSIKGLGYQQYMAKFLDPTFDNPRWLGANFDARVKQIAESVRDFSTAATDGDILANARDAIWRIMYQLYSIRSYTSPLFERTPDGGLHRSLGKPLSVTREEGRIVITYLDSEATSTMGTFGFHPSRFELPASAEVFAKMLESGSIDTGALVDEYGDSTAGELKSLVIKLGIFHE